MRLSHVAGVYDGIAADKFWNRPAGKQRLAKIAPSHVELTIAWTTACTEQQISAFIRKEVVGGQASTCLDHMALPEERI
jgi:hypothetical protein